MSDSKEKKTLSIDQLAKLSKAREKALKACIETHFETCQEYCRRRRNL